MLHPASAAPTAFRATDERILDAALGMLEDSGLRHTTVEGVARRARVSRITVHRRFRTKDELIRAVVVREVERFLIVLERAVGHRRPDEVVEGFALSVEYLRRHRLLQTLLRDEPGLVLPHLTLDAGPVLAVAARLVAPRLPAAGGDALAEVLARLALSFVLTPSQVIPMATTDDARSFARRFLVPMVEAADRGRAHRPVTQRKEDGS